MTHVDIEAGAAADGRRALERELEAYRVELRAYCYRMLGSAFDAEDAVQDALVRAWRNIDRFEGRSSLRSWLYRIATNVCLDVISRRQRRALPADLGGPGRPGAPLGPPLSELEWIEPVADRLVVPASGDPSERAVARDSVRLAFIAALQVLPARQRAALILREVLAWRPSEIAALLGTTVVSVNSALQRARQTLAKIDTSRFETVDSASQDLLDRYVAAFERDDVDALVELLHEDATWSMPPYSMWFRGVADIRAWWIVKDLDCRGFRMVSVAVNGTPGFALYRRSAGSQGFEPFAIQSLDIVEGRIANVHSFLDPRLFSLFDLPPSLTV